MRRTRTRTTRNPQQKSAFSLPEDEMTGLGLFSTSSSSLSSSSSSNLSPLALPFTVERSNNNKFNPVESHFNFNAKSDGVAFWSTSPNFQSSTTTQGLLADSIRTATVPSTFSNPNPNPITAPTTRNRSVNLSAIGPNQRAIGAPFSTFSSPFSTPSTHNWSSMNSSVKSGLEPVNPPAGHLFGMNPNSQPHKWSLGSDDSVNDAPMVPLNFNLLPYGSSQGSYSQSLSGSKYNEQAYGSQGKQDSSMFGGVFGHPISRENNTGSSTFGKSHVTSPFPTCQELVSTGISNETTFTWNGCTSRYPFETRYDSLRECISPSMMTKSLDVNSSSLSNNNSLWVSHDPLKEKESYQSLGFQQKSSLNSPVPDMNSTEEVTSAAHLSEHLDHHNPGEDSPCWKGAPSHISSSGSQEQVSSQHLMKKLQNNIGEDVVLPMDQTLHGTVENAANVVTSESLDVNMVVKALNNLSELLLCLYSKDECGLKEQDHKALDHVIANLNVCMSSKFQQVDAAQKCSSYKHTTSSVLREERNNDQFGKNIEELQSTYIRDEGLPKDYNMVQKIKRVLDENIECTEYLPSDPLLYKNLWLEAEAELCVSSYRNRLHRAKREMGKSKALVPDLSEVASDIKKISSSNHSPTASELLHEAAGSKTSNTNASDLSLPVDDVENSVMARFNILKRREESNSVNLAEKEPADVEASGSKIQSSGVAKEPHLQHLLDADDVVVMHSQGKQKMHGPLVTEDVDHAVMARLNILKSRGELDHVNAEQGVSGDGHAQVSEEGVGTSMMQNQFGPLTTCSASSFGWEYVIEG